MYNILYIYIDLFVVTISICSMCGNDCMYVYVCVCLYICPLFELISYEYNVEGVCCRECAPYFPLGKEVNGWYVKIAIYGVNGCVLFYTRECVIE